MKLPTNRQDLVKALIVLAPKMPASAVDLGAGRGYARYLRELEKVGWIECDRSPFYLWRLTDVGKPIYEQNK